MAARLQINLLISPNPNIALYTDVPKHFMPILWFEQRVTISPEMAAGIAMSTNVSWIGQVCSVIVLIIGLLMLLWFPFDWLMKQITGDVETSEQMYDPVVTSDDVDKGKKTEIYPYSLKREELSKNIEFRTVNSSYDKVAHSR